MVTDLPKYMSDVLRFSIQENGLYTSLPYLIMWIVSVTTGFLSDWLSVKKYLSITNCRKVFTGVGKLKIPFILRECINLMTNSMYSSAAVFPAFFIIGASYAGCDRVVVVAMFTLAMGFMGTYYPGMKVNPLDLSPNYAATLMALTNGIGACAGIAVPYVVGVMTPNVRTYNCLNLQLNIQFKCFYKSTVFANGMAFGVLDLVWYLFDNHRRLLDMGLG